MKSNHWKSLLVFVLSIFVVLCCCSAIDIFVFNHYETKFGGPWHNLIMSLWLCLSVAVVTGAGYLTALFGLRNIFKNLSLVRQFVIGVTSGVTVVVLTVSGAITSITESVVDLMLTVSSAKESIEHFAQDGIVLLVSSFVAVGAGVGAIFILLASISRVKAPNQSIKRDV